MASSGKVYFTQTSLRNGNKKCVRFITCPNMTIKKLIMLQLKHFSIRSTLKHVQFPQTTTLSASLHCEYCLAASNGQDRRRQGLS